MNIENKETIESEFLKFKDVRTVFPSGKDYVNIYQILKEKFDKKIHPEIKTKILEIEKSGYYNDHGVDHIAMVIERVSRIISCLNPTFDINDKDEKYYISPYELFILLMAIQLHDTGHLIASRADHAKAGKKILAKFDDGSLLTAPEKKIIGEIAQAHGGKDDPIGKLESLMTISHQKVRPQLLASFLRLGDELAEDETRASTFLLKINEIEKTSKIFHLYSASLDSVSLNTKEIALDFYVTDKYIEERFEKHTKEGVIQQYLIDEIYERTQKTLLETLYCSRFLPEKARFTSVNVKITLLKDEDHDEFAPRIGYILKETGYPLSENKIIYDLCPTLKNNKGEIIDGKYIANLLKSLHNESI